MKSNKKKLMIFFVLYVFFATANYFKSNLNNNDINKNSEEIFNTLEKVKDFHENDESSTDIIPKIAVEAVNVCITEVYADSTLEWIEIYNPTGSSVDLTGWLIMDGDDVTMEVNLTTVGSISAGQIITIGDSGVTPTPNYTADLDLNDKGDDLIIKDDSGNYQDVVVYGVSGGGDLDITIPQWYWSSSDTAPAPGALGESIERLNITIGELEDNNVPSDWELGTSPTPGSLPQYSLPPPPQMNVSITELCVDGGQSGSGEWLEIYNPTGGLVDCRSREIRG